MMLKKQVPYKTQGEKFNLTLKGDSTMTKKEELIQKIREYLMYNRVNPKVRIFLNFFAEYLHRLYIPMVMRKISASGTKKKAAVSSRVS